LYDRVVSFERTPDEKIGSILDAHRSLFFIFAGIVKQFGRFSGQV
jgi:hypothetical protein